MTVELPTINYTTQIPDSAKVGGRIGGENVFQRFMLDMPAPQPAKGKNPAQYAWFFVPAEVADTITDEGERDKAAKTNTQKLVNKFTSIARRIRKANSETHDYTFRKVRDPNVADDKGTWGLVVYRIIPGMPKPGPGSKAAAA